MHKFQEFLLAPAEVLILHFHGVRAYISKVPGFVSVARNFFRSFGEGKAESVFAGVFGQPSRLFSVSKRVFYGVYINRRAQMMLGMRQEYSF